MREQMRAVTAGTNQYRPLPPQEPRRPGHRADPGKRLFGTVRISAGRDSLLVTFLLSAQWQ